MRKILNLALSLCLVIGIFPMMGVSGVHAASVTGTAGDLTYTYEDGTITISGEGAVVDNFCTVARKMTEDIRENATSVVIESGVTSIGVSAFTYFPNLSSVTIASSVKTISSYAFFGCSKLKSISIPSAMKTIGKYAFSDYTKVELPDTMQAIEDGSYIKAQVVTLSVKEKYKAAFKVLTLINKERTAKGLSKLKMDKELLATSMVRAREVALYFSHTRPSGLSVTTASEKIAEENVAMGQTTPTKLLSSLMGSEKSKAKILDGDYVSVGIGATKIGDYCYWTMLFGTEKATKAKKADYSDNTEDKTVTISLTSKVLSPKAVGSTSMSVGNKQGITLGFDNGHATVETGVTGLSFKSSDKTVATVSKKGKVKAKAAGSATIKIFVDNYSKAAAKLKLTIS